MNTLKTVFVVISLWLVTTVAQADSVWAPTWTWRDEIIDYVSYVDHSSNCTSSVHDEDDETRCFPQICYLEGDNSFGYRMYAGQNTENNVGSLDVEYFLMDKVVLEAGGAYVLKFNVITDLIYWGLRDAKVKVQLTDCISSDANVLKDLGEIDLCFNTDGQRKMMMLDIDSAPAECYVRLILTGKLIFETYSCYFSDFSIERSGIVSSPPVITKQPETSLNFDIDNIPTLSVEASGEKLSYKWYSRAKKSYGWGNISNSSKLSSIMPVPGYMYKCVVSNPAGEVESEVATVQSVIVHGKEMPEGSGKYYISWTSDSEYSIDENTVAYKVVWDETNGALKTVAVNVNDQCIQSFLTVNGLRGGLILQSSSPDILLSKPWGYKHNTSYDDNVLVAGSYYKKGKSYLLGCKDGILGMYPGEVDDVPRYTAIYNTDGTMSYPDGIKLTTVYDLGHRIVFDKNADDATGWMANLTVWDEEEGKVSLTANAYKRDKFMFMGWSTTPDGEVEFADAQLLTKIPASWGDKVTLYAQWEKGFIIDHPDYWYAFYDYAGHYDPTINARLTCDIIIDGSKMELYNLNNTPYRGTFDGGGHTITIYPTYKSDKEYASLFRVVQDGTIKNLNVYGSIESSNKFASSLIGYNMGGSKGTTIENCTSNVHLWSRFDGEGSYGGIVGLSDGPLTIKNCAFTKIIEMDPSNTTNGCAGFVGLSKGQTTITNSLLSAKFNLDEEGCSTFARGSATVENCYYVNSLGNIEENAAPTTMEKIYSGEVLTQLGPTWSKALFHKVHPEPYVMRGALNYVYNDGTGWVCDSLRFDGNGKWEVNFGLDFTAKKVSCNRDFILDDGYYTVYMPLSIPAVNGKFYACTGVNADKSEAEFIEVASPEPNTPYIFLPSNGMIYTGYSSEYNLNLGTNVEIKKTTELPEPTGCLRGVYDLLTFTDENKADCYGYAAEAKDGYEAGAFVKLGTGATVPSGRAYIYAPEAKGVKMLKVVINGVTTDLTIPVANDSDEPKQYYNLSGQLVGSDYKGIVICNGKKMLRR